MGNLPDALKQALENEANKLLAGGALPSWDDVAEDLRQEAYAAIADTLLGSDRQSVAAALIAALRDDKVTPAEWRNVLSAWVGSVAPNNPIVQDIAKAVADGPITKQEAIGIALKWAEDRVKNDPVLHPLLDNLRTLGFNTAAVKKSVEDYIQNAGLPTGVTAPIVTAIESGTLTPQEILQAVAAWAALSAPDELKQLLTLLSQNASPTPDQVITAWLGGRTPKEALALFTAIQNGNWVGLMTATLGLIDVKLGQATLDDLADGKFRDAATAELTDLLTKAGVDHAGDFVSAVVDLATGARSLFANGSESDAPELVSASDIELWQEIRGVIYSLQLFTKGGSVVPTNPQAQPHVFEAAAIRLHTPLSQLIKANASMQERGRFCNGMADFLDAHFHGRILPTYAETHAPAFPEEDLAAGSGAECIDIYGDILIRTREKEQQSHG